MIYYNLIEQIKIEINRRYCTSDPPISFILMHPKLVKDLMEEIGFHTNLTNYTVFGYKVYRSEDIEYGEFKIG